MNNKISFVLTLTLLCTTSFSFASKGKVSFKGKISEPTCTVSNSVRDATFEITGCYSLSNSVQTRSIFPLSDINKVVNQSSSKASILDNMNKLTSKHNIKVNITRLDNKNTIQPSNYYIIAFEYY